MSYPSEAMAYSRVIQICSSLEKAGSYKESEKTDAFKRALLRRLLLENIDCRYMLAVAVEGGGTLYGALIAECNANVAVLLAEWVKRLVDTGYDYIASWEDHQIALGS